MADIRKFMSERGWTWKEEQRPGGRIVAVLNCPFCGDTEKKFAIKIDDGAFKCNHANRCGVSGSFWELQKMLGISKPEKIDKYNIVYTAPKYERPKINIEPPSNKAVEYLKGRGIWEAVIHQFKMGQVGDEIMFPYYKNGELLNVKYRSLKEKKFRQEKNAEPSLFGQDFCKGDYVVICEGEIDAMSLSQLGEPAVSIPSGAKDLRWVESDWEFLQKFQKIYLCFDNDAAGQENISEIVKRLGAWRCYNIILPCKDANEWIQNNDDFETVRKNAHQYDPEILKNAAQFKNEVLELFNNPDALKGLPTPWAGLNNIIRGWRDGELTIVSGRNGSGKTTWLNQVIIDLIKKKQKTIIASLELPPKRYLRWMALNILGDRHPDVSEVEKIIDWLGEYLYVLDIYGAVTPEDLLSTFEFAARKYGVNKFVIDSLLKINFPGVKELQEQKDFVNACIDRLCKYFSGHTWLVAHPRKSQKDSDEPDKVDIEGTGAITNLADNVAVMTRKPKDANGADNRLYIKKCREWGDEGKVEYIFKSVSKTFVEL